MATSPSHNQRPGFSILVCPDSELLRLKIEELLLAFRPAGEDSWQRHVFWGDDDLRADFWEHLTLQGLFARPKAIVLRQAQNIPAARLKALSNALASISDAIWPLICFEVPFEKGKPKLAAHISKPAYYQHALQKNWVIEVPGLDERTLPGFIKKEAPKHGISLKPGQAETMAARLLPDAALVGSELSRLALTADGQGLLPADFAKLLEHNQEVHLFDMLNLIQDANDPIQVWRKVIDERLGSETTIFAFLSLLLREARALWQILAGETPAIPPFLVNKKRVTAKRLGFSRIAGIFELALDTEKSIKSGEKKPEQAYEILMADLFYLFGGR